MSRQKIYLVTVFLLLGSAMAAAGQSRKIDKHAIVFEAIVEKMAPPVPPSGILANYRIVKYQVTNVCQGTYVGDTVVVDHFVTDREQFDGFDVGTRVYLAVLGSKSIERKFFAQGIRNSTDVVDKFYITRVPIIADKPNCTYTALDLFYPRVKKH